MSDIATETPERDTATHNDAPDAPPRRRYELDDRGFREVICPVCKVVIRSVREFRAGDRAYCMPCMSRMIIVERPDGTLEPEVTYERS